MIDKYTDIELGCDVYSACDLCVYHVARSNDMYM
jgi:hypothetical protein